MTSQLRPALLWKYFQEISGIPRDSKQEEKSARYVMDVARRLGLEARQDAAGNVLVLKPGNSKLPPVILQAHLDMVCEKNEGTRHDFTQDYIKLVVEDEWVRAQGTTLGADNGIGLAAMLAIMEDTSLVHPPLELLFTIDEETGLTGAMLMEPGFIGGQTLINLDSEDDAMITVGCAGGRDTDLLLPLMFDDAPVHYVPLRIILSGLRGGHSGTDIHRGRGNALKLLARFLSNCGLEFFLADMQGGSKHNAIPREAQALIYLAPQDEEQLREVITTWAAVLRDEYAGIENQVSLEYMHAEVTERVVISPETAEKVLALLNALPHGVIGVDFEHVVVTTSTNLAICKVQGGNLYVQTSQRSVQASLRDTLTAQVVAAGKLAGAQAVHGNAYPGWKPDYDSRVLAVAKKVFVTHRDVEPGIRVIHAGLECGVIGEKISGLDMISIGPTIRQAHSPFEEVHIPSVERFWTFLLDILATLAQG